MKRLLLANPRLPVVIALAVVCAACEHVPLAPIDPAANAARIVSRSLADPSVGDALARHGLPVAEGAWSLDQLTLAAWTLRTDLAVARAEVAAARAGETVEGQRSNPSVTGNVEKVLDDGEEHPWVIGAALSLKLEPGGKREIRGERAAAQTAALEWGFGETLWTARAEVRAALLDLVLAGELVALDEEDARLARAFFEWVDARFSLAAATTSERFAATQQANEAESRRQLDTAARAAAAARLAAAVGVAPSELAAVQLTPPELAELPVLGRADVDRARDLALVNRLDVRRALADYAVAEQDLRGAVASQYPDFTLAPGYLLDQDQHKITFALDVPVPLFHDAKPAIRRALAERAVAAAKVDDVQAGALAAIDVGFARYESARDALAAATRAERAAADSAAALERRLAAGAANRGELLAGQIAHVGLRRSALEARRAALDAATALENAIERPFLPQSALETEAAIGELLAGQAR
ncbi:MAG TPA: TolC family protein [Gammaproteobacteria bacterium]|nr:TolC family protein [Gammaproteobacteria bacterium]